MKTTITLFSILALSITNCIAQTQTLVSEAWAEDNGTQNFFQKSVTKADANRNVYIAGATVNLSGNYDLLLTKFDSQGNELWTKQVTGTGIGDDFATAIYLDDISSYVYVTGTVFNGSTNNDIILLKYKYDGTFQWSSTYNGTSSGNDVGGDITLDGNDDIYITGATFDSASSAYDFITVKYNASAVQQWVSQWDNIELNDASHKISFANDGTNTVNVAGGTQTDVIKWQYAIVKYDASTGALLDSVISGGDGPGLDKVTDIARDSLGNIYVTGGVINQGTAYDCYTLKLDSTLTILWSATYNGADSLDDVSNSIEVDSQGNVYICGYTTTTAEGKNYITIKYDASGGEQWTEIYNRISGNDEATALALRSDTEIIITGSSSNGANEDYFTIKYSDNADMIWSIAYDGGINDKATDVAIDNLGGIIVAGQSQIPGAFKYVTVKYEEVEATIPPDSVPCPSSFAFYQNRGQLINTNDSASKEEKYYTLTHYPGLYFYEPQPEKDYRMMSYMFSRVDTNVSTVDTLHKVDLTFELDWEIGEPVNTETRPVPADKNDQGYLNYFLGHCAQGITYVEGFNKLYYPSAFENTDILFYGNNGGMKFYIIIKPGAEPDVNLKFTGQDSLVVTDSTLEIVTGIGSYAYPRPEVFQIDANGDRQAVSFTPAYANWGSGRVGFTLGSYDTGLPLVIEVGQAAQAASTTDIGNLNWSTYIGGNVSDQFRRVYTDAAGNIYLAGWTFSSSFPVLINPGPFTALASSNDALIIKLDSNGQGAMRTYYGGNDLDNAASVVTDASGNIYFMGVTESTNLPQVTATATLPNGDSLSGGQYDFYVVKLNPGSNLIPWAHYIGGSGAENIPDMVIDPIDMLYLAGNTFSTDFPYVAATFGPNPFNQSANHGNNDIVLMKMNTSGTVLWSTYFGGPQLDKFYDLEVHKTTADINARIFFTGFTTNTLNASSNALNPPCSPVTQAGNYFPDCDAGGSSYQQQYMGNDSALTPGFGADAIIVEFDNNGNLLWSTMFGGLGQESGNSIKMDNYNNVYLTGFTDMSCDSFPLLSYPGGYNQTHCNLNRTAFIAKFDNRDLIYSSFIGGSTTLIGPQYQTEPWGLAVDSNENFFVTGHTHVIAGTSSCFPVAANNIWHTCNLGGVYFLQTDNNGAPLPLTDGFIMGLNKNCQVFWSTFIGGQDQDQSWDINVFTGSPGNKLYVTGNSYSPNYNASNFAMSWPYLQSPPAYDQPMNVGGFSGMISRFVLPIYVGIDEKDNDEIPQIACYPNPTNGEFVIQLPDLLNKDITFNLVDVLGRIVITKKLERGKLSYRINISSISDGLYIANIIIDNKNYSAKIVKHD